jgi:hypothetical protein
MGFISGVPAIDPSLTHGPEISFVVTGDSSIPARHPYQGAIADEITFFDGFCQGRTKRRLAESFERLLST